MGKKKAYHKSLKECENIHVFMKNWYGVKSHHRKRTKFHHNDMPIYLIDRGITPPKAISFDEARKCHDDSVVFVRDDNENIRCYKNDLALKEKMLLEQSKRTSEQQQLDLRRKVLRSEGYDYDPCTGEVDTIEQLEYLEWLYSITPTEKVNRQSKQKIKSII